MRNFVDGMCFTCEFYKLFFPDRLVLFEGVSLDCPISGRVVVAFFHVLARIVSRRLWGGCRYVSRWSLVVLYRVKFILYFEFLGCDDLTSVGKCF